MSLDIRLGHYLHTNTKLQSPKQDEVNNIKPEGYSLRFDGSIHNDLR